MFSLPLDSIAHKAKNRSRLLISVSSTVPNTVLGTQQVLNEYLLTE